jgi:DNA-binding beta-propeller fold protein YncE
MKTYLVLIAALFVSACGPAQVAATNTPEQVTIATSAPINTSTPSPVPNPVEFVMHITGDPNPLYRPGGITVDRQGNLYVADGANDRIQIFDSNGHFLTMWGTKGEREGEFHLSDSPGHAYGAVAVDAQGTIYIADTFNYRIQKFTNDGKFLTMWGSKGEEDGQFLRPINLEVDSQGNVYVIDDHRDDVQKFDSEGTFLIKWGGSGQGDG